MNSVILQPISSYLLPRAVELLSQSQLRMELSPKTYTSKGKTTCLDWCKGAGSEAGGETSGAATPGKSGGSGTVAAALITVAVLVVAICHCYDSCLDRDQEDKDTNQFCLSSSSTEVTIKFQARTLFRCMKAPRL